MSLTGLIATDRTSPDYVTLSPVTPPLPTVLPMPLACPPPHSPPQPPYRDEKVVLMERIAVALEKIVERFC